MSTDPDALADPLARCARGRALHAERRFAEAVDCFRQALAVDPRLAEAYRHLGRSLNNLQRLDEAVEAFREALRLDPDDAETHDHLGHVLRAQGALEEAAAAFAEAARIDPGLARAHHNLGIVRNAQGRTADAVACLQRALEIEPADAAGWSNLGKLLQALGRDTDAIEAYRQAIVAEPRLVEAHASLGALLWDRGRLQEAGAAYGAALGLEPAHEAALAGMAGVLEVDGRYAEALALIEPFMGGRPGAPLVIAHARLLRRLGRAAEARERLDRLVATAGERPARLARAHFTLGDLHDDLGDYDAAFAHYRAANAARSPGFDPASFTEGVESLIEFFTPATLAALPRSGLDSERPVFIVGMPRSGTSLVEQILAAHPRVHPCGERDDLYVLARDIGARLGSRAPYPDCLRRATAAKLGEFAMDYLEKARAPQAGISRITDKLPTNFLNLGLIELLFPGSRIIECRRHPLDTAISCYFQHFASRGLAFTHRLEHIGVYMNLYRRIMAHWREVLSLPMLSVEYEALVAEPEASVRRLLSFLELDWEPRCLRFHELKRRVATASYAQVREPIYRRSVGRYRNYEPWLGPLVEALKEGEPGGPPRHAG